MLAIEKGFPYDAPKLVFFALHMQKLQGFKVLMIDDPKATWEHYVEVVDILKINMYFLVQDLKVLVLACSTSHSKLVKISNVSQGERTFMYLS